MKSKSKNKPIYESQIMGAADAYKSVYDANRGNDQAVSDSLRNGYNSLSARAFGPNPTVDAARGLLTDTMSGKYLDSNPYTDQMAAMARSNTGDQVNSMFGKAGGIGSSAHMENLGRGMSSAELAYRASLYDQERGNQMSAAGMVPSVEAAQYAGVQPAIALAHGSLEAPYTGVQNYGQGVGGLLGQYQKTSQTGGVGQMLGGIAGSVLSGWAQGGFQ